MSETKTHWKKLDNPDYFGAWSIPHDKDLVLTIDYLNVEKVKGEKGREEQCKVCHFKEKVKPMILNSTNSRQITALHGSPYIEDWSGKQIQVFQDVTDMKGTEVECVRIRPFIPNKKKEKLTPDHPRWEGAIATFSEGKTTIEKIKKHFDLEEKHEKMIIELAGQEA